ncbi:MAG: radical SAM protein [Myxococcota bacterium]|jgi:uncharacterized protein|nr:radical SAM protein [Myxococcota bacterium]
MLRSLYLMPTHQCNGACSYCYLPEREADADAALFVRAVSLFIAQMQAAGVDGTSLQLRFSGGEPCLRPELLVELSTRFLSALPGSVVRINSNGTLVDEALTSRLRPFAQRVAFIVSLDGPPAIHNARRRLKNGNDAHAAAVRGIETLQRDGIPVYLNAVLDRFSLDGLGELMDFIADRFGMRDLGVSLLDAPQHPLSAADKLDLLRQAYALAAARGVRLGGHHRLLLGELIPELYCRAGRQTIVIGATGEMAACQRFVGKGYGPVRRFDDDVDFHTVKAHTCSSRCYAGDVPQLAQGLYELYQQHYPEYCMVNALDRVLFGVI